MNYEDFFKTAISNGLCDEYKGILNNTKTNEKLYELFCSSKGIDYVCNAIAHGWGVTNDEIQDRFGDYINGKKIIYSPKGYSSSIYCSYKGHVIANSTILGVINCDRLTIDIPEYSLLKIYITGKCNIRITGDGRCICVCYGNEKDIVIQNYCSEYKRINKKEADSYE